MSIFEKIKQSKWNKPFLKNRKIDQFLNIVFWIALLLIVPFIIFFIIWVEKVGGLKI